MTEKNRSEGRLTGGLVLLFLGIWFLADSVFRGLPGLDVLWPVFPILAGVAALVAFLGGGMRGSDRVFPAVAAIGIGFFFLPFTFGLVAWDRLSVLWPVFPAIAGVAFFWSWAASFGRRIDHLRAAIVGLAVGVVGLLFTLTPLAGMLAAGWPIVLILVGAALVLGAFVRSLFGLAGWARRLG
jgi:hypothetical protein